MLSPAGKVAPSPQPGTARKAESAQSANQRVQQDRDREFEQIVLRFPPTTSNTAMAEIQPKFIDSRFQRYKRNAQRKNAQANRFGSIIADRCE